MKHIYKRGETETEAILAYSMPGSNEYILATPSVIKPVNNDLEDFDFIFAPFDSTQHSTLGIKISSYASSRKFVCHPEGYLPSHQTSRDEYTEQYASAKEIIRSGQLDKIVLSKVKHIQKEVKDIFPLFIRMKNTYVSAFSFLLSIPGWGTWVGASPELVLREANDIVCTRAIAGTRSTLQDDIEWSEKEVQEHRFIETYLKDTLSRQEILFDISDSYTISAGPVSHICSDITIESSRNNLAELIDIIHPGPALSGMPKQLSIGIIRDIESHDREYYCGYLGLFDKQNGADLYATIRCMQVYEDGYRLYLGGGITSGSKLESEWDETEFKAETLMSIINMDDGV